MFLQQFLKSKNCCPGRGETDPDAEQKTVLISNRDLLPRGYKQFLSLSGALVARLKSQNPLIYGRTQFSPWTYDFLTFWLVV